MTGQKASMVKSLSWINPFTKSILYQIIIITVVNYFFLILYHVLSTFKSLLHYLLIVSSDRLIIKLAPALHPSHLGHRGRYVEQNKVAPGTLDNDQLTLRPMSKSRQDQKTSSWLLTCTQRVHILLLITDTIKFLWMMATCHYGNR